MQDARRIPNYPPSVEETAPEFVAPGPVSRVVANYLDMCAPLHPHRGRRRTHLLVGTSRD